MKDQHPAGKRFALLSPAFEARFNLSHRFVTAPLPETVQRRDSFCATAVDFLGPCFYKPPHVRAVRPALFSLRQPDDQLLFPEQNQEGPHAAVVK
jgi:hypothetical protein